MGKYAKLLFISTENNNKYYLMTESGGQINIEYGRVDHTSTKLQKPLSQWDTIYKSKIKKGYKDVTAYAAETTLITNDIKDNNLSSTGMVKVDEFMTLMQQYTDGLVKATYSVTAKQVTQQQVDDAQKTIDKLMSMKGDADIDVNKVLIELYTIIPRRMSKVQHHLLPTIKLENILDKEQDNLDAMASQVAMQNKSTFTQVKVDKPIKQTILDSIGITMKEYKGIPPEIEYLTKQCTRNKIAAIFEVNSPVEDKIYTEWLSKQKDKTSRILIHGTRNSSVIPILKNKLQIRPSGNFTFSGAVYGSGLYFSEVVSKSLNYTGYDKDKVLLVFEVHTGNPHIYDGWFKGSPFTLNYKNLQQRGCDSTYVKAGGQLLNSEIIVYTEQQNRIKYIIWLK